MYLKSAEVFKTGKDYGRQCFRELSKLDIYTNSQESIQNEIELFIAKDCLLLLVSFKARLQYAGSKMLKQELPKLAHYVKDWARLNFALFLHHRS